MVRRSLSFLPTGDFLMSDHFFVKADQSSHGTSITSSGISSRISLILGALIAAIFFAGGLWWSRDSTAVSQTAAAPSGKPPFISPVSLPKVELSEAYRVLAEALCLSMASTPQELTQTSNPSQWAELHRMMDALEGLSSADQEIQHTAQRAHAAFTNFYSKWDKLQALPSPTSAGQIFMESFLSGAVAGYTGDPTLVMGSVGRGFESDTKAAAKQQAAIALCQAERQCDAIHQTLPRIAQRFAAPVSTAGQRFTMDINDPWGKHTSTKWFCLHNNGANLTDCTLQVQLAVENGTSRRNVHFVKHWPATTWMYAQYKVGVALPDGTQADSQCVAAIQSAEISLWSPEYSTQFRHEYQGTARDADIRTLGELLKIQGKFIPFQTGILWDTEPGAELKLQGIEWLPPGKVTLVFRGNGGQQ